ncbi:hypothetical protein SBADM41S_02294 [Streptomyces badius]
MSDLEWSRGVGGPTWQPSYGRLVGLESQTHGVRGVGSSPVVIGHVKNWP